MLRSEGVNLNLEHVTRDEVLTCIANTERLAQFADVTNFVDPLDFLSRQVHSDTKGS